MTHLGQDTLGPNKEFIGYVLPSLINEEPKVFTFPCLWELQSDSLLEHINNGDSSNVVKNISDA